MIVDVPVLLDELCMKLGFCLDPADRARLSVAPPADVEAFAIAVLVAEGLDPLHTPRRVRHDLRECIARYEVT